MTDMAVAYLAEEIAKYSDEALDMYERGRREGRVRRNPKMDSRLRRRRLARNANARMDQAFDAVNSVNQTVRNAGEDAKIVADKARSAASEIRGVADSEAATKLATAGENLSEGSRDNAAVRRQAFEQGVPEPPKASSKWGSPKVKAALAVGVPTANLGVALGARALMNRSSKKAAVAAAKEKAALDHRNRMIQLGVAGSMAGAAGGSALALGSRPRREIEKALRMPQFGAAGGRRRLRGRVAGASPRQRAAAGALAATMALTPAGVAAKPLIGHGVDSVRYGAGAGMKPGTVIDARANGKPLVTLAQDDWTKIGRPGSSNGFPQYVTGPRSGVETTTQYGTRKFTPGTVTGPNQIKLGNPQTGLTYDISGKPYGVIRPGAGS